MTGEIDLKGRVLPVGGIKEKLLGAMAFNLSRACIPWRNQKDLEDIPADLKDKLEILPVKSYDDIYPLAFPSLPAKAADTDKTADTSSAADAPLPSSDNV